MLLSQIAIATAAPPAIPPDPGFAAHAGSFLLGGGLSVERGSFSGDAGRSVSLTLAPDAEAFVTRVVSLGVRGAYVSSTAEAVGVEHVFVGATATAWLVGEKPAIVVPRASLAAGLESFKTSIDGTGSTYTAPAFGVRAGLTFWPDDAFGLGVDVDVRIAPFQTEAGQANYTTWTLQVGPLGMFNPKR